MNNQGDPVQPRWVTVLLEAVVAGVDVDAVPLQLYKLIYETGVVDGMVRAVEIVKENRRRAE